MRLSRLCSIAMILAMAAFEGGCGGSSNPENQVGPNGLTPKQEIVTKQMLENETAQKAGNAASK